jgi:hypothetical protein
MEQCPGEISMKIVDEKLLDEFRQGTKCELCGEISRSGLDPHHIFQKGLGGGGRIDLRINIIALDRKCHSMVHNGMIKRDFLLEIVAKREFMTVEEIIDQIHAIRRLPKGNKENRQ